MDTDETHEESKTNGGIFIPKWFLVIVSGCAGVFLAIFIPWASWLTYAVIALEIKIDQSTRLEGKLDILQTRLDGTEKLQIKGDQELLDVKRRLDDIERRTRP